MGPSLWSRSVRADGDVDVIWYDPVASDPVEDRRHEAMLRVAAPGIAWSVKNQARMHLRNGDGPYSSATDAMRHWPETATAIAVRRRDEADCDVAAPLGLNDLMHLILRPTSRFIDQKRAIYDGRIASKRWIESWPGLRQESGEAQAC